MSDTAHKVSEWPPYERPREKLVSSGARNMNDSELLAILLRTGNKNESAVALAKRLLTTFGGIPGLSRALVPELSKVKGVGLAKGAQILAALELGRRLSERSLVPEESIRSGESVYRLLGPRLREERKESFWVLLLDTKHRLRRLEKISEGTLSMTPVHPREAFSPAVRESAAAVIFVHNHPSGDPEPSPDDWALTTRLVECGTLLGIRVLDHVVTGDHAFVSLRERGAPMGG
ncbi:MAG: RadC family protein [Leptospirillia bacterium]